MNSNDPFLTQLWPWSVHIEFRRKYLTEEQMSGLLSVLNGESLENYRRKMKSEDISDAEIKSVASYIIERHADDIEYLSVTEMTEDQIENLRDMDIDEQEKVWHRVDDMIGRSHITITFED